MFLFPWSVFGSPFLVSAPLLYITSNLISFHSYFTWWEARYHSYLFHLNIMYLFFLMYSVITFICGFQIFECLWLVIILHFVEFLLFLAWYFDKICEMLIILSLNYFSALIFLFLISFWISLYRPTSYRNSYCFSSFPTPSCIFCSVVYNTYWAHSVDL